MEYNNWVERYCFFLQIFYQRDKRVGWHMRLFGFRFRGGIVAETNDVKILAISLYELSYYHSRPKHNTACKHYRLLEWLLGERLEHISKEPVAEHTTKNAGIVYTVEVFKRFVYYKNFGHYIKLNNTETYKVTSTAGDCCPGTFSPPNWAERPNPNVIINQAKAIKVLIDNYTLD